ncbi:transcription initiation factor tfiid subunit 3 [Anaeramoeba flamelloides]|uniref:Transcription initiation factor tfiid subunit 3 n=1 Tax=Anaeramoeba flamelloides TaxID=1746091 RepID=A0ABQ8X7R0_9EUKA|nr:transcription initiation factor tfiid subunit 3 [Anaeramoeba flamelloides]
MMNNNQKHTLSEANENEKKKEQEKENEQEKEKEKEKEQIQPKENQNVNENENTLYFDYLPQQNIPIDGQLLQGDQLFYAPTTTCLTNDSPLLNFYPNKEQQSTFGQFQLLDTNLEDFSQNQTGDLQFNSINFPSLNYSTVNPPTLLSANIISHNSSHDSKRKHNQKNSNYKQSKSDFQNPDGNKTKKKQSNDFLRTNFQNVPYYMNSTNTLDPNFQYPLPTIPNENILTFGGTTTINPRTIRTNIIAPTEEEPIPHDTDEYLEWLFSKKIDIKITSLLKDSWKIYSKYYGVLLIYFFIILLIIGIMVLLIHDNPFNWVENHEYHSPRDDDDEKYDNFFNAFRSNPTKPLLSSVQHQQQNWQQEHGNWYQDHHKHHHKKHHYKKHKNHSDHKHNTQEQALLNDGDAKSHDHKRLYKKKGDHKINGVHSYFKNFHHSIFRNKKRGLCKYNLLSQITSVKNNLLKSVFSTLQRNLPSGKPKMQNSEYNNDRKALNIDGSLKGKQSSPPISFNPYLHFHHHHRHHGHHPSKYHEDRNSHHGDYDEESYDYMHDNDFLIRPVGLLLGFLMSILIAFFLVSGFRIILNIIQNQRKENNKYKYKLKISELFSTFATGKHPFLYIFLFLLFRALLSISHIGSFLNHYLSFSSFWVIPFYINNYQRISFLRSLKISFKIAHKNLKFTFLFLISLAVLFYLGLMLFFIGCYFVCPYLFITIGVAYKRIFGVYCHNNNQKNKNLRNDQDIEI